MSKDLTVPRVAVRGVSKTFGATRALVGADLEVRAGEVHTVMGENGSGKSTLVKILSGVHRPDAGELAIDGDPAGDMRSPAHARSRGVATVFQEVLTVPGQTIAENVWLGSRGSHLSADERRERAASVLEQLLGEPVDPSAPVESLSLSGRQAVCIARSLVSEPRLLILDESTSALDIATRDRLFALVRALTTEGTSVLFISHRMDEVFSVSDVFTVLRSGRTVASRLDAEATTPDELVHLMSGTETLDGRRAGSRGADVVLETPLFPLHEGEVVGLAGLEGQGQEELLKSLRGAQAAGPVAYVPRERRAEGIFEQLSIAENFALPTLTLDTTAGVIRRRRTAARLASHGEQLRLKMGHSSDAITTLSGGNQQKVIISRALADDPTVLLLNDPTRGIDQNAKNDIYTLIGELLRRGLGVVLLSTEVDELVHLADRVLVFEDGEVSADLTGEEITREAIVSAYFGAVVP
ncbi:sugar ABC transporter ATP-binding protein [Georgenia sp. H159]|uniref:sugar ABC transporter ATP-binding protein n=1 Tax=Georgenia sp. H159 TaxID=3076115 RepID=UPI002D79574D|nr:sugar ABC transporter ATP-binding protein [Georgenia sp. H159]